jgi:MFS-type transporter involved in bile tolerance (Atg22 family)
LLLCDFVRAFHHHKVEHVTDEWVAWEYGQLTRRVMRGTIYVMLCIVLLFMGYLNLIFGVQFITSQSNAWITTVFVGCFAGEAY